MINTISSPPQMSDRDENEDDFDSQDSDTDDIDTTVLFQWLLIQNQQMCQVVMAAILLVAQEIAAASE
jgi:hypothetical protein